MTHFIDFEPIGRRGECKEGDSLLECARTLGVDLVNICGGNRSCGSCVVQILKGRVSALTDSERKHITGENFSAGYRLACHTVPESDCKVRVPPESMAARQRIQVEGRGISVAPDPVAKSYFLELPFPSLEDPRSDVDRLTEKLAQEYKISNIHFDFAVLGDLSTVLRENDWRVNIVLYNKKVVAVLPAESKPLGVAVDLGTTKIAMYLMELESGQTLAIKGITNPQIAYGEDIITRISAAQESSETAKRFQSIIVEALNEAITDMCEECKQQTDHIVNMVVVGNTAMHHLFLGFPVKQLGLAPYVPEVSSALDVKGSDLGLKVSPGAFVHLLPNIAAYVGGDHVAMLLASGMSGTRGNVLAIDIGTNTEICLAHHGTLTCLSTACGPAFEGAHIKHGMRATAGAIEHFQILDGKNTYQTIESAPPIGMCGSGVLDVLAQLYKEGIIDNRGKLSEHPLVRGEGKSRAYVIASIHGDHNDLTFTQDDIEQLQLAKGAIRAGINLLLARHGLSAGDIDKVIIAGAFGTYLSVRSAIGIGMLPDIAESKIHQIGNAAGVGAKEALISKSKRNEARELARNTYYIELAGNPEFMNVFAEGMLLG